MSQEEKASIRANRDRLRTNMIGIVGQNSKVAANRRFLNQIPHGEEENGSQKPPQVKPKLQRKKSLNIPFLPKSFEMFECGEIEVNHNFEALYEMTGKLGEGTQSVVHQCTERETGVRYAVKVIRNKDSDLIHTLKKQFLISKSLNHENILKTYSLFIDESRGVSHIVMQYCPYENLRFFLNQNRVIPEPIVAQIVLSMLKVLSYLHGKGICHRDVKPENILYDPEEGNLKLIDFQICKRIRYDSQKLDMWTNTGTLQYKSPEMLKGGYSYGVDIWALGVTCYEMLTGRVPFGSLFQKQTIRQIELVQPVYEGLNITESCTSFMKKCLQKDPTLRITAKEALQSPFMLKCRTISTSGSPRLRRNGSHKELKQVKEMNEESWHDDEDSEMVQNVCHTPDSGIRLVVDFSEDWQQGFL